MSFKFLSFGHISIWALETDVVGHGRKVMWLTRCNSFQDSSEQLVGRFGGRHIRSPNPKCDTHSLCFGKNASALDFGKITSAASDFLFTSILADVFVEIATIIKLVMKIWQCFMVFDCRDPEFRLTKVTKIYIAYKQVR